MLDSLKKQQAKLTGRSMRLELQRRLSRLSHCEPLERSFKMDYEDTLRCLRLRSCLSSVFNAFHEGMEPPEQCDDPSHSATVTVRATIIPRSDVLFDSWFDHFQILCKSWDSGSRRRMGTMERSSSRLSDCQTKREGTTIHSWVPHRHVQYVIVSSVSTHFIWYELGSLYHSLR